jgi:putative FmdB family regulatory protein
MPTYEYECTKCNDHFEVFQSMKDAPLTVCNKCGGKIRRVISGGEGVIFKGSGFYVTDNSSSKEAASPAAACPHKDSSSACASCPAAAA